MQLSLLEPFFTGSHAAWAQGWQAHSRHELRLHTLPGRYWKWRMYGGAVSLAKAWLADPPRADLLLATDMLDLNTFLSLTRRQTEGLPVVLYWHENQLTYPWSPKDPDLAARRDRHYAFTNYRSALAADALWFNSAYHQESFLSALPDFLRTFPDWQELDLLPGLAEKSQVMPLGLDLQALQVAPKPLPPGPPVLLWNHRWEYDKAPEAFFRVLFQLAEEGLPFRLVVLGESYRQQPPIFAEARERLQAQLLHWGYVENRAEYAAWLRAVDLLPVTAMHDFFGASVVEAIAAGVWPLLPRRLAYPEHLPPALAEDCLYETETDLLHRLRLFLRESVPLAPAALRQHVMAYDWQEMAPRYDLAAKKLVKPAQKRLT